MRVTWAVYLSRGAQKKTDRVCTIVAQARAARAPPVRGNERGRDDEQDNDLLEAWMAPMPADLQVHVDSVIEAHAALPWPAPLCGVLAP